MNVVSLSERAGNGRGNSGSRPSVIAALDVGTTKICCLIARVVSVRKPNAAGKAQQLQVIGMGHQLARGIKNGAVVDMDEAERAIRAAVDAAERMADVTVESVFVNVSGGRPACRGFGAELAIHGRAVTSSDMAQVLHLAGSRVDADGRTVLHSTPIGYALDGTGGIKDPEGMFGESLGATLNVIAVDPGPMRNLAICIERCHLAVAGFVIAPFSSGLSTLVADEKDLGVTCIDMGGGTTGVSVFMDGNLVFSDVVPVGGAHVTTDIARGLSTPIAHAERIKALYGSALPSVSDDRELIAVPLVGERGTDTVNKIPKSILTGIIQPRIEETLELVRDRIRASGYDHVAGRRMVLTGGASQMTGARALASSILDKQVRMGMPAPVHGLPEAAKGPAFAVATGLLRYAMNPDVVAAYAPSAIGHGHHDSGYLTRMGRWIRESF